jgi:hypothetical protein
MASQIVIVKASARAGHIKSYWVREVREDGWVGAVYSPEALATQLWIAPHNVITFTEPIRSHDYNGIPEGTLVSVEPVYSGVGMVIRRRGSRYDVLVEGREREIDWSQLRPIEVPCDSSGQ